MSDLVGDQAWGVQRGKVRGQPLMPFGRLPPLYLRAVSSTEPLVSWVFQTDNRQLVVSQIGLLWICPESTFSAETGHMQGTGQKQGTDQLNVCTRFWR